MPQPASRTPCKAHGLERAKAEMHRPGGVGKSQRGKRHYPKNKLEVFGENLLNQLCVLLSLTAKMLIMRLKRQ
jgi:hypothetical protein